MLSSIPVTTRFQTLKVGTVVIYQNFIREYIYWYKSIMHVFFILFCGRKSRKTSPPYKVLLHNDNFNKREYVVQVLMKVIPGMTVDTAVNIMQEAHYNGMAVVIVCGQPDAEEHCMQLRGNGLLSSIEPASGGC